MIKAISNKKVNLTKDEYSYYLELEKKFGKDAFRGLFQTDDNGKITSVTPSASKPTAMVLIFFFLNLMLNQKLRELGDMESRIKDLERAILESKEDN